MKSTFCKSLLLIAGLVISLSKIVNSQVSKKPNIILILADDMGYSDLGSYGGEVQTPNLDKLALDGIRYKQFYNAARCCPTRASLVTGLYPHQAGMGWMAAADLGTPAYQGNLNNECVTIAEILKLAGYSTYMTGKWHLTNERKIDGMVMDNWPKQRGFDRYFGIIPGGANYYTPMLYSNNVKYKAPENFYLTTAISDTSVNYIDQHFAKKDNQPMFMYVAYTAPHWPLHALQKDIDKYKEQYKAGWDKMRASRFERQKELGLMSKDAVMSPRDRKVEEWDSLSEEKRDEMAMRMAIYAAQIDVMDKGIGSIVQKLKEKNQLDNTLIFFLSDNGACAEFISSGKSKEVNGKEDTFESYRIGWANVSSTPFKEFKHWTYEGGIATPLIAHWPKGIDPSLNSKFINDYGHITDIMATCVEVADVKYPSTFKGYNVIPMQGKSLVPHFSGKTNNRGIMYWEHEANIAIRDGKWKLVAKTPEDEEFSKSSLELYDMEADPVEMHNLASKYPNKVNDMYNSWYKWAKSIKAFPLDTRKYNVRSQAYKKQINGSFDDNLGGWNVKGTKNVGSITIDTNSVMTGEKSVMVSIYGQADKPAVLVMTWDFVPSKGEKYMVKLNSKANKSTSFFLNVKQPQGAGILLNQAINTFPNISSSSNVFEIKEKGPCQLALYFGKLTTGTKVWLDDVELIQVN